MWVYEYMYIYICIERERELGLIVNICKICDYQNKNHKNVLNITE